MSLLLLISSSFPPQVFWRFAVTASFPLALGLMSASPSVAQIVYGRGPGTSNFQPSFVAPSTPNFGLDQGVTCPTPSFNANGFVGTANDYANANSNFSASSNSGVNNYGITVGFSVPLGGDLSKFCKDFAASKTSFERRRVENQLINSQLALIKHCQYLYQQQYDFNNEKLPIDGQFASLINSCRSLIPLFVNLKPASPPTEKTPDEGEGNPNEKPFSPPAQPVYIINPPQ